MPATLALVAISGFILLTQCLGHLAWGDAYVAACADVLRGGEASRFVRWLTRKAPNLAVAVVVLGAVVARRRGASLAEVVNALGLLAVALLLLEGLKLLVVRERPGGIGNLLASSSYPSGHVAHAAFCVVTAVALIGRRSDRRDAVRAMVIGVGSLFVVAVAATRIYVGLHWLSDVTASLLLGIGFGGVLHLQPATKRVLLRSLALVAIPSLYLTAACGFHVMLPSPAAPALSPVRSVLPSPRPGARPRLPSPGRNADVVRVGSASYAA